MAIKPKKTSYSGTYPVFWRGEFRVAPAGYKLLQTFPAGTKLLQGTPISIVPGTLTAAVSKVGNVLNGGTTTKPRVTKDHYFQANDIVMRDGDNTGVTVSSIDTSNADYDVITLSAAITGLKEGDTLIEASGATDSVAKYIPNAVVETTKILKGDGDDTVSAGYDGVVIYTNVNKLPASWMTGFSMKENPSIKYLVQ